MDIATLFFYVGIWIFYNSANPIWNNWSVIHTHAIRINSIRRKSPCFFFFLFFHCICSAHFSDWLSTTVPSYKHSHRHRLIEHTQTNALTFAHMHSEHTHSSTNKWMNASLRKERLCVSECTIVRILHTALQHCRRRRRCSILNMPHQHKSNSVSSLALSLIHRQQCRCSTLLIALCLQQQSSGPTLSMCVSCVCIAIAVNVVVVVVVVVVVIFYSIQTSTANLCVSSNIV